MPLTREQARRVAQTLAAGRAALGIAAIVAPRLPGAPWVGEDAARPSSRLLARALGGRDLALGLGALLALRHGDTPVRGWIEAGGLADAGDVLATLVEWKATPKVGRWLVLAAAGGAAAAAGVLAPVVDARA